MVNKLSQNLFMRVDLSKYDNSWFYVGSRRIKILLWYFVNVFFFLNPLNPFSSLKVFWLRSFGAKIGNGVVIKPSVNIKYPWNLTIGDYTWIGENVWIDNLVKVNIGSNVCISQGAMLLCGNHDYKRSTFDLIVNPIIIEDGAWVGAKTVVCPGTIMRTHCVLTVGSVASKELSAYSVYRGSPAVKVKDRIINE